MFFLISLSPSSCLCGKSFFFFVYEEGGRSSQSSLPFSSCGVSVMLLLSLNSFFLLSLNKSIFFIPGAFSSFLLLYASVPDYGFAFNQILMSANAFVCVLSVFRSLEQHFYEWVPVVVSCTIMHLLMRDTSHLPLVLTFWIYKCIQYVCWTAGSDPSQEATDAVEERCGYFPLCLCSVQSGCV